MRSKVILVFLTVLLFQNIKGLTRSEIRLQYEPTLRRLNSVSSVKYQEATREYNALTTQIQNQQTRAKNASQTQITNIKTIIANAKTNVSASILSCLRTQEYEANRLTITSLNYCYSTTNSSLLINTKARFTTLASLATNTVNYCGYLNPLTTQDESFQRCLAEKIPDLNRQINIVENDYNELSNATLHNNIKCLTDNAGAILGKIGIISYQINVCFFTPL